MIIPANLVIINRKKNNGLIVIASKTINLKAKFEMNFLAETIAKKNKINFYKKILVTLSKENLNLKYDRFLILPIFLFRGNLLDNLISVIKEINKKSKNKFILCSHLTNYKNIFNLMNNLIKFKIT